MAKRKIETSSDYKKSDANTATHGLSGHSLYYVWLSMKRRCQSPKDKGYKNYGGRGITICQEWEDVSVFFEWAINNGYQNGKELDRVDNNKGYSPDNCRFVNHFKNQRNRRNTLKYTYNGEEKSIPELAAILDTTINKLTYCLKIKKIPLDVFISKNFSLKKTWDVEFSKKRGEDLNKMIHKCGVKKSWVIDKMNKSGFNITASKFSNKLGGYKDFFTESEYFFIEKLVKEHTI